MHFETSMMNRRNRVAPFLVFAGCILFLGYSFYIYSNLNSEIDDAITKTNKCESHGKILKQQLKVVYHHTTKLEEALKKEKEIHKNTRQEYTNKVRDYEINITKSKHEALNRFNALDTNYKMLKANNDELNEQHQMLQQTYMRLTEDHKKVAETAKHEYEALKSEKDTESFSLQARIQELFNSKVHYQEQAKLNQDYYEQTTNQLKSANELAAKYMERIRYYEEHVQKLQDKLKTCESNSQDISHQEEVGLTQKLKFTKDELSDMDDDHIGPIKEDDNIRENVFQITQPPNIVRRSTALIDELKPSEHSDISNSISQKTLRDLLTGNDNDETKLDDRHKHYATKEIDTADKNIEKVFISKEDHLPVKKTLFSENFRENDAAKMNSDETKKLSETNDESLKVNNNAARPDIDDVIITTAPPLRHHEREEKIDSPILSKVQNISSSLRSTSYLIAREKDAKKKLSWKEILKTTLEESAQNIKEKPVEKPGKKLFPDRISTTVITTTESMIKRVKNHALNVALHNTFTTTTRMTTNSGELKEEVISKRSLDNERQSDKEIHVENDGESFSLTTTNLPAKPVNENHVQQIKPPIAKLMADDNSRHVIQSNQLKPPNSLFEKESLEKKMSDAEIEAAEYNHDEQNVPEPSKELAADDAKNERFYDSHVSQNENAPSEGGVKPVKEPNIEDKVKPLAPVQQPIDVKSDINNVKLNNDNEDKVVDPLHKPVAEEKDVPTFDSHVSENEEDSFKEGENNQGPGNEGGIEQPHILNPNVVEENNNVKKSIQEVKPVKEVALGLSNFKSKIDSQEKVINKLTLEDDENGDQNLDQNNHVAAGQNDNDAAMRDNDAPDENEDDDQQRGVDESEHAADN